MSQVRSKHGTPIAYERYVVVSAEPLDAAGRWALLYIDAVQADEVDIRELE